MCVSDVKGRRVSTSEQVVGYFYSAPLLDVAYSLA